MTELLALLGRFWPRLLFPCGIGLLALAGMLYRARRRGEPATLTLPGVLACAAPLLALALLPLPATPYPERDTDLLTLLVLLELPHWHALVRARGQQQVRGLVAALNWYPALLLAGLALHAGPGSINLAPLASGGALVGGCGWALALAGLLAHPEADADLLTHSALRLRALGHVALGALLLAPALPEALPAVARLLLAFAGVMVCVLLGRRLEARVPWSQAAGLTCGLLVAWLLWQAGGALYRQAF